MTDLLSGRLIGTELTKLSQDWDVVVIGAGPAGALSALELAKRGFRVLLVDKSKFPKAKVCGCCLNQDALGSLKRAGLLAKPVFNNAPVLKRLNLYTKFGRASIALPGGLAISRQALDGTIVEAAIEHGCSFLSETTAQVGATLTGGRTVALRYDNIEKSVTSKFVVVGDGISGTSLRGEADFTSQVAPSSRIGIGALIPNCLDELRLGEIDMYCGQKGYLGIIIVENGMIDAAAAIDRKAIADANSASVVQEIMLSCGATPPSELLSAHWRGTSPLSQKRRTPASDRVFLVGDAAGYTEPFTGQGIAWALRCALLIAPLLERALKNNQSNPEKAWSILYAKEIRSHQRASSLLAKLLRYERVFSLVVAVLSMFPGALRFFLEYLNREQGNYQAC
jgi:flavin-dependent dehydrogenase